MDFVFEIADKSGRLIYLTKERWNHIKSDHPEMSASLDEIKRIITEPEFIRKSEHGENVKFYYRHYKGRKTEASIY